MINLTTLPSQEPLSLVLGGEYRVTEKVGKNILHHLSPWDQMKMSCVNKDWREFIFASLEEQYPDKLFPKKKFPVRVIDIASWIECFGEEKLKRYWIDLTDTPTTNKRAAIARLTYLYTHAEIEGNAGVTILTRPRCLSLRNFSFLTEDEYKFDPFFQSLKNSFDLWNNGLRETHTEILSNNVFNESRRKSLEDQKKLVGDAGCKFPEALSIAALVIVTHKKFGICLFGGDSMLTYTVCKEQVNGKHFSTGFFNGNTLSAAFWNKEFNLYDGAAGSVEVPTSGPH